MQLKIEDLLVENKTTIFQHILFLILQVIVVYFALTVGYEGKGVLSPDENGYSTWDFSQNLLYTLIASSLRSENIILGFLFNIAAFHVLLALIRQMYGTKGVWYISPALVWLAGTYFSETLFGLILALALYFYKQNKYNLSIIFAFVSYFIRHIGLVAILVFSLWFLYNGYRAGLIGIGVLGFIICISIFQLDPSIANTAAYLDLMIFFSNPQWESFLVQTIFAFIYSGFFLIEWIFVIFMKRNKVSHIEYWLLWGFIILIGGYWIPQGLAGWTGSHFARRVAPIAILCFYKNEKGIADDLNELAAPRLLFFLRILSFALIVPIWVASYTNII